MIRQIFTILNLLHNRFSISKLELREACGVSDRTIYRYINQLSEANIPIYYDRNTGGYRLLRSPNIDLNRIGVSESIIIGVAIRQLQQAMEGAYSESLGKIQTALQRITSVSQEEMWPPLHQSDEGQAQPEAVSHHLTYLLILEAINLDKKLAVETSDITGVGSKRTFVKPSLRYARTWQLFDLAQHGSEAVPIADIKEVIIK